jgi:hypothetical protein
VTEVRSTRPPRDLKRTIVIIVGVIVALNFAIIGLFATRNTTSTPDLPSGLIELRPARGYVIRPQETIGVHLDKGFTGELTLDSTPLPKDQYEVAGIATGFTYWQPGPGKEFSEIPPGKHTLTVHYWPTDEGPGGPNDHSFTWDFKVG